MGKRKYKMMTRRIRKWGNNDANGDNIQSTSIEENESCYN